MTRKAVRVLLEIGEEKAAATAGSPAEKAAPEDSDVRQRALSHPDVKRFQELFPGAQVRTVRNLNE